MLIESVSENVNAFSVIKILGLFKTAVIKSIEEFHSIPITFMLYK